MIRFKLTAVAMAVSALVVGPTAALAQSGPMLTRPTTSSQYQDDTAQERSNRRNRNSNQQPAAPDPAKVKADAQAALTAAGNGCSVTDATLLGQTAEQASMYEAVCATGPGFIIVASTPAQVFDCAILASQAQLYPDQNPQTCSMPANQNAAQVFMEYGRAAGVPCTVDEGVAIGRAANGATVYEIGCAGADGYWIEQNGAAWTKTPCVRVVSDGKTCRFTTPQEQNTTVQALLANTPAAECVVEQYRLMGGNANGEFYEVKCQAGTGRGYIVRVKDGVTDANYRCAIARPIGGGCTLTPEAEWTDPEDAA